MACNYIIVLASIFFCASCILQTRTRAEANHGFAETIFPGGAIQRWNSSTNVSNSFPSFDPLDTTPNNSYLKHYAGYYLLPNTWHGGRAKMNLWKIPDVKSQSSSLTFIAASNHEHERGEVIAAGIHVYPRLYNNTDLRFFTYWTADDGKSTGCYNDYCPGFVIANGSNLFPGQALTPLSSYDGDNYYITIRIKKDEVTGDWSLYREDMGGPIGGTTLLGWWPRYLFRGLSDFAMRVDWAGEVYYQSDESSPSMGSGHLSGEGEGKSAYFKDILAFDSVGIRYIPPIKEVTSNTDKTNCYDVSNWLGDFFYYGGPGSCS